MPETVDATSRALQELVPRSLSRAAVVCTPSRAVADQVLDAYGPAVSELLVTPLGVDPEWLQVERPDQHTRQRLGLPEDYFLFVGTREPRKDLATLLAAYAQFRAQAAPSEPEPPSLLLVGPDGWGPGREPAPGVQIMQYAPTEQLRSVVAGARALIMPSRDEGFGLPALEGLAAGVAVIVSDVPALVEVTGGHAAVFRIGDVAGLAEALLAAAQPDADGPAALRAKEIRRSYAAQWTWQRCAEQTAKAYRIARR